LTKGNFSAELHGPAGGSPGRTRGGSRTHTKSPAPGLHLRMGAPWARGVKSRGGRVSASSGGGLSKRETTSETCCLHARGVDPRCVEAIRASLVIEKCRP